METTQPTELTQSPPTDQPAQPIEKDLPQDQDIIDKIKEEQTIHLKPTLLQLNKYNNDIIHTKEDLFHKEYLELKHKYELQYADIYTKMKQIAFSKEAPTTLTPEDHTAYTITTDDNVTNVPVLPDFWLTILENTKLFKINDKDKEILSKLMDIRVIHLDNMIDCRLEFEFEENEYFEGNVLCKTYMFDPKTEKLTSTKVEDVKWKDESKNPGIKVSVKTVKKKKKQEKQTVVKEVATFFDMFNTKKSDIEKDDEEIREFQTDVLPNMLEYYLRIFKFEEYDGKDDEESKDKKCECTHHKHKKK